VDARHRLIAKLLYGAGLRLLKCLSLRIKDVDFGRAVIVVRSGKGNKDRVVMFPGALRDDLRAQVAHARSVWAGDRAAGRPGVAMPEALQAKFPRAGQTWAWSWLWPAREGSAPPRAPYGPALPN
jgi:integrase